MKSCSVADIQFTFATLEFQVTDSIKFKKITHWIRSHRTVYGFPLSVCIKWFVSRQQMKPQPVGSNLELKWHAHPVALDSNRCLEYKFPTINFYSTTTSHSWESTYQGQMHQRCQFALASALHIVTNQSTLPPSRMRLLLLLDTQPICLLPFPFTARSSWSLLLSTSPWGRAGVPCYSTRTAAAATAGQALTMPAQPSQPQTPPAWMTPMPSNLNAAAMPA